MTSSYNETSADSDQKKHDAYEPVGGEDESSAADGKNDDQLHEDQKPINGTTKTSVDDIDDDPHKTEKLTKAGRDIDPDAGSD